MAINTNKHLLARTHNPLVLGSSPSGPIKNQRVTDGMKKKLKSLCNSGVIVSKIFKH